MFYSNYHVIHEGRIIATASNPTSARHKALEHSSNLKEPATMHIYDGINQFHVGSILVEPKGDVDEHTGLDENPIETTGETLIKKSASHPIFGVKVFFDKQEKMPKFFQFDHEHVFDIDNDDWIKDVNPTLFEGLDQRGVTVSDLSTLAAHDLIDESDIDELHQQGFPVKHVKQIFNKMNSLKNQVSQLVSAVHGKINNGDNDDK